MFDTKFSESSQIPFCYVENELNFYSCSALNKNNNVDDTSESNYIPCNKKLQRNIVSVSQYGPSVQ